MIGTRSTRAFIAAFLFFCAVLYFTLPGEALAWTAEVTFDAPANPTYETVVLVSEISGDFSQGFGQQSEPGATTVEIGNIKPSTEYFFVAYRLIPDTGEKSAYSNEVAHTTEAYTDPIVVDLPPIPLSGVEVSIAITMKEL